jgi:ParB-like chromosome segregation protein Spo0J
VLRYSSSAWGTCRRPLREQGRSTDLARFALQPGGLGQAVEHPRTEFAEENVDDLAQDIRERGILQAIVVRDLAADPDAQVAENLKRHAPSPIEIARFIKGRIDAGESNVTIAKRIGMNLTSVAHHLTLLELPPERDPAMQAGRCARRMSWTGSTTMHPRR